MASDDTGLSTEEREGIARRAWIGGAELDVDLAVREVASWVQSAERVLVVSGAGISTDSGIPDFRGRNGVWTRDPAAERASTIEHYMGDPAVRRAAWRIRSSSPAWAAEPNLGHRAIVALEAQGRLDAVVTQNTDGLHIRAGLDPERVIEVHGTMRRVMCTACGDEDDMRAALARVEAGEDDPPCLRCGGILKAATILFGESLVPEVISRAEAAARRADLVLAVGTTLNVYPAALVPAVAQRSGARLVIVNGGPTDQDERADAVIRGSISAVLPPICGA